MGVLEKPDSLDGLLSYFNPARRTPASLLARGTSADHPATTSRSVVPSTGAPSPKRREDSGA